MNQYHLTLLGMCEVRWNSHGETRLPTGEVLLYSEKDSETASSPLDLCPDSRMCPLSCACYAPTNNAGEDDKDSFYAELQSVVDKVPGHPDG